MKFKDLPIKNIKELNEEQCYIIANIVKKDENEEITALDKVLLPATSFGYREEIMNIGEQSTGFVNIINKLVQNYQELNKTILEIKNQLDNIKKAPTENVDSILNAIAEMEKRLDKNLVEL